MYEHSAQAIRRRGARSGGRSGRRQGGGRREQIRLVQLMVCLLLFLTVFVGKGVFPGRLVQLRDQVLTYISADFDFRGALAELGESPETIKMFCRDMLGHCDYAICEPFPNVDIAFPTTVADGEGEGCAMTITRKKT